jgi:hypothetical protein
MKRLRISVIAVQRRDESLGPAHPRFAPDDMPPLFIMTDAQQ